MPAAAGAIRAYRLTAAFADVAVFVADDAAAVVAGKALPVVELNEGASARIVAEDSVHDQKEICHPAARQSTTNHAAPISLTQPLVLNMRVSHRAIDGGWIWVQGNYAVSRLIDPGTIKLDLEPAEVDAIEDDRFGDDAQLSSLDVHHDFAILLLKGDQLLPELRLARRGQIVRFSEFIP